MKRNTGLSSPQEAPEGCDILVSELLGSFGDNELSPECLDGAQRFLKEGGIRPGSPCRLAGISVALSWVAGGTNWLHGVRN